MSKKSFSDVGLRQTEQLLWKFITAPEGVAQALEGNPHVVLPILGDKRLSAVERLDIYANMYFYRILGSLKEDFPRVLKMIGDDRFHNLITDYLLKHFPSHWSLRYAGGDISEFLEDYRPLKRWPFLSELARLEWALLEAFDAGDAALLNQSELFSINPDQWENLRFRPVPSFQFHQFRWPVDQLFKRNTIRPRETRLIVWRKNLKVFYRSVDPLEAKLFQGLLKGDPFGRLCEVAAKGVEADRAGPQMVKYLRRWIKEGLICLSVVFTLFSTGGVAMAFSIKSPAFDEGGTLPKKHACDGGDLSPPLKWSDPPAGTKSFALIMDDPDAPPGTWVHWVLYDLPATVKEMQEGLPKKEKLDNGAKQGLAWGVNDFSRVGYYGPCPPPGPAHRYYFKLYALDTVLNLPLKATKFDFERGMKGHLLGEARLMGKYGR